MSKIIKPFISTSFELIDSKISTPLLLEELKKAQQLDYIIFQDMDSNKFFVERPWKVKELLVKTLRKQSNRSFIKELKYNRIPSNVIHLNNYVQPGTGESVIRHGDNIVGVINNKKINIKHGVIPILDLIFLDRFKDWDEEDVQFLDYYREFLNQSYYKILPIGNDSGAIANKINANFYSYLEPQWRKSKRRKSALKLYNSGGLKSWISEYVEKTIKPSESVPSTYILNVFNKQEIFFDENLTVLVSIDLQQFSEANVPLQIPDDTIIDIYVHSVESFTIQQDLKLPLNIPADIGKKLYFELKPLTIGAGTFKVYAFIQNKEIANLELKVEIIDPSKKNNNSATSQKNTARQAIDPSPPSINPDLTIQIFHTLKDLHFTITATNNNLKHRGTLYGPHTLQKDPEQYFMDFYKSIEGIEYDNENKSNAAARQMKKKGAELYNDLFPPPLRDFLWSNRKQFTTVFISSTEPWVPWEICFLSGMDDETTAEDKFFCERYNIGRWIPQGGPSLDLSIKHAALIVPEDSKLPYAEKERIEIKKILERKDIKVKTVEASYLPLEDALSSGKYSLIHFTGHGNIKNPSSTLSPALILNDGVEIKPEFINIKVKNLGKASPIVFLNACQVGKSIMGLTGIGGWAHKFITAGASAFIGAYWSVTDEHAYHFATKLYEYLLMGKTIGEAVNNARSDLRAQGDPTWLAYTLFADPNAKLIP